MPDDVFVEAGRKGVLLDVGDEAVFVFAVRELFDDLVLGCHLPLDSVTRRMPRCRLKSLVSCGKFPPSHRQLLRIVKNVNIFLKSRLPSRLRTRSGLGLEAWGLRSH